MAGAGQRPAEQRRHGRGGCRRAARGPLTPARCSAALDGRSSHAYLLHGPAGTGKRAVAHAFATALLAEGAPNPTRAPRVEHRSHPDLMWVSPSGAHELLVATCDPSSRPPSRTPFEASRRVFVIERADTMNDEAANRMLKTLEEPPAFVDLLLLTDRPTEIRRSPRAASTCASTRSRRGARPATGAAGRRARHGRPPARGCRWATARARWPWRREGPALAATPRRSALALAGAAADDVRGAVALDPRGLQGARRGGGGGAAPRARSSWPSRSTAGARPRTPSEQARPSPGRHRDARPRAPARRPVVPRPAASWPGAPELARHADRSAELAQDADGADPQHCARRSSSSRTRAAPGAQRQRGAGVRGARLPARAPALAELEPCGRFHGGGQRLNARARVDVPRCGGWRALGRGAVSIGLDGRRCRARRRALEPYGALEARAGMARLDAAAARQRARRARGRRAGDRRARSRAAAAGAARSRGHRGSPTWAAGRSRASPQGLAALHGRAEIAYVSAADVPLLAPRLRAPRVAALDPRSTPTVPAARRHAAAARGRLPRRLAITAERLLAAGERRARALQRGVSRHVAGGRGCRPRCAASTIPRATRPHARPAPAVTLDGRALRAATLGAALGGALAGVTLNGLPVAPDPELSARRGRRAGLRHALGARVDVDPPAAREAAQGDPAVGGQRRPPARWARRRRRGSARPPRLPSGPARRTAGR